MDQLIDGRFFRLIVIYSSDWMNANKRHWKGRWFFYEDKLLSIAVGDGQPLLGSQNEYGSGGG
ncbi:hypothetical protein [Paenibacillus sp. 481]|uniref:hypothetical protein n=1 Tax=Paenibacillus sp. 481 TaxID=2835869 RepID=UPI001E484751|nr:hypothetical protein [Paenibacillus sp. 481]UHA73843.1 hypothetical protein KIK04_01350 [Paenibacillus sp. 481]